jgi:membrane-associated protease RseP (regulator of RpoE activity)
METNDLAHQLLAEIGDVFAVDDVTSDFPQEGAVRFRGRLLVPHREAYAKLRDRFAPYKLMPVVRRVEDQEVLLALPEAQAVSTGRPWVNVVLFVATVLSVMLTGAEQSTGNLLADILSGWPMALGLMGILLAHEFGHYFAARYHGVPTSLPYFIPMPLISPFGTFGAVIVNKGQMRDRRALLDIGAAGPLAGLIVAIPILLIGLSLSTVDSQVCPPGQMCYSEGNSLLYAAAKYLVFGRMLPSGGEDVWLHPLAFAGWAGILVTALNLLPVGTLDGGHVAHALWGRQAGRFYLPVVLGLAGLGFLWQGWWLWAGLTFMFGRMGAQPLDDATPLDGKRKVVAVMALAAFVLTFTPIPILVSL